MIIRINYPSFILNKIPNIPTMVIGNFRFSLEEVLLGLGVAFAQIDRHRLSSKESRREYLRRKLDRQEFGHLGYKLIIVINVPYFANRFSRSRIAVLMGHGI